LHTKNLKQRRLTIWSAGCSSGEEVYTIAILINKKSLFKNWDVKIFGSDINGKMILKARNGIYHDASFRSMSPADIKEYFYKTQNGWRIDDNIKSMCHFARSNIFDREKFFFNGKADVIFCRNVLMYFDKASRINSISIFHNKLNSDGYLLLGHTESLLNMDTPFNTVHLKNDTVYQRSGV
jgi:chemotaxis protein methyltransferase CheR